MPDPLDDLTHLPYSSDDAAVASASLDELKRRAYSADGEDARTARLELAELAALARLAQSRVDLPLIEVPAHAAPSRKLLAWLAALASLAAIAATGIISGPRSSLAVFDRPATALDAAMDERVPRWFPRNFPRSPQLEGIDPYWDVIPLEGSARWLGKSGGYDVFGYLAQGVAPVSGTVVCLSISRSQAMMVIWRESEATFLSTGMEEHRQSRPVYEPVHVTVRWGPTGDALIYDRPLDEVPRR